MKNSQGEAIALKLTVQPKIKTRDCLPLAAIYLGAQCFDNTGHVRSDKAWGQVGFLMSTEKINKRIFTLACDLCPERMQERLTMMSAKY